MTYDEIFASIAESTGLSKKFVSRTYRAYWKAVREHITSLPLKEDMTEEEFSRLQPNVNVPSLGKLHVSYKGYCTKKKQYNIVTNLKNKEYVAH